MARSTIIKVKNNTGATIPSVRAVYLSGYDSTSGVPTIALSSYNDESTMPAVGIVRDEIGVGEIGTVKTNGILAGFDTSSVTEGAEVYVGLNGVLIFTDPFNISTSTISQQIATVAYSASEERGQIFLFPLEIRRRVSHPDLLNVTINQHHNKVHAPQHARGAIDELSHSILANNESDDHLQYSLVSGGRAFTGTVGGIDPLLSTDLATKAYVDNIIGSGAAGVSEYTFSQNKRFWNDSFATVRKDLDGYAPDTTVSEHYAQHSQAIQTILKDLDGYAGNYFIQTFVDQTSVVVTHNFGNYPCVDIMDDSEAVLVPQSIVHQSVEAFTVTFAEATTGTIIATCGVGADGDLDLSGYALLVGRDNSTDFVCNLTATGQIVTKLSGTHEPTGTTQTIDWDDGNFQIISLASAAGNVDITFVNPQAGATYVLEIIQHAVVPKTVTFSPTPKWPGGVAPIITATASAVDMISLLWNGTIYCGNFGQDYK